MSLLGNFFGSLGYLNHMRSMQQAAEKYYRMGLRFGGMSAKNEGAFGVLLLKQGNFEEAERHFDASLSRRKLPRDLQSLIRMNRAITWFRMGRTEEAISTLEELHRTFKSLRVYQTLGYVYTAAGMYDKAEPYNLEAGEYDSEDAVIADNAAQMYLEMGDYEKAKHYAEKSYGKRHFSDVLYHMGLIAEHEGRDADALMHYREAMSKKIDALNDVTPDKLRDRIAAVKERLGITEEEDEI